MGGRREDVVKQTRNHIGALLVLALVPAANGLAAESPKTDEDCRRDDGCNRDGRCLAKGGKCVAASEEDCRASRGCTYLGACGLKADKCVPTEDRHCGRLEFCRSIGLCSARDGKCVAAQDADCLSAQAPKLFGQTIARNGQCVVPAQTSEECSQPHGKARFAPCELGGGQCTAKDGWCQAVRDEECKPTTECKERGQCTAKNGSCQATRAADCKRAKTCEQSGMCVLRNDRCTVGSDSDCAKTTDCKKFSHCTFADGGCMSGTVKAMSAITGKVCACKDAKCLSKVKATFDKIRKDLDEKGTEADRQTLQAMVARASECMDKLDAPKQPDVKSLETEF
jgi:hypothetical protein